DGELVAAEPESLAQRAEPARDLGQHRVAGRMAVAVVDLLEVVEVEEADGERAARGGRLLEVHLELLLEMAVVPEPGERVGERESHRPQRVVGRALVPGDRAERGGG